MKDLIEQLETLHRNWLIAKTNSETVRTYGELMDEVSGPRIGYLIATIRAADELQANPRDDWSHDAYRAARAALKDGE